MKVTNIIYTMLLTITSIEATAIAAPEPKPFADAEAINLFCHRSSEPCGKLKRAAEAAAEGMAKANPVAGLQHDLCYRRGWPCSKAKREALALAEAVAEALAFANPKHNFCYEPGEPCSKTKREALAAAEALAEAEADANPDPAASKIISLSILPFHTPCTNMSSTDADPEEVHRFCYGPGEPCSKVKRAAEAIAAAIAEPAAVPEPEAEAQHRWCYQTGEPCSKHKRALDGLSATLKKRKL